MSTLWISKLITSKFRVNWNFLSLKDTSKFQVSKVSNGTSHFKSHLELSSKQPLWWIWKVSKVSSFKSSKVVNITSFLKSHLKVSNKQPSIIVWKVSKVSNSTSHFKSHLKVSNKQEMRLETRCAISALHKANWLPCYTNWMKL